MCVCYSFHTNQISAYIGMQRIEEAKLVTAGRDFTPNFANKPNSVWFINAQIFWTSSKVYTLIWWVSMGNFKVGLLGGNLHRRYQWMDFICMK